MRKYISPDLRVINCANDIIATSGFDNNLNRAFHSEDATLVGGRRDMFDDSYDEF